MRGNTLVADIDGIPYVINLSDEVSEAYHTGHIPLNTLSNAVLRKWDEQVNQLSVDDSIDEQESFHRSRGIQ